MIAYVIIPFFQRESGILRRALDSIADQRDGPATRVLVIDDASPVSPHSDIESCALDPTQIEVIVQANAGPGAARNRGLDHVPDNAGLVAFLDSDDQWTPDHLRNARAALGDDLDFYFSNYREPDSEQDQFRRHGRLDLARHAPLARADGCYRFSSDMIEQIMFANVIETSTVVYRWDHLKSLRFRSDYRAAFEDHLFWIAAAQLSRGIAFSTNVECQYGRGVNLWRSATFGSERALARLLDQRRYCREIDQLHVRTRAQAQQVAAKVAEIRESLIADLMYRVRRRLPLDWRTLAQFARIDPAVLVYAVPLALKLASRRKRLAAAEKA